MKQNQIVIFRCKDVIKTALWALAEHEQKSASEVLRDMIEEAHNNRVLREKSVEALKRMACPDGGKENVK